jgi:CRISPR-associated protein Cas1
MSWRVVDLISYEGEVHSGRGRIKVGETEVPLEEINCLLIGAKTRLSGGVVLICANSQIPILTCDWKGIPVACTYPWSENSKIAKRFHAQIDATVPQQKNAWMQVVKAKISGQAANLEFIGHPNGTRLFEIADKVRSGDPDNFEASAARTYWSSLYEKGSFSRQPGEGEGMNAVLDYGYAVLRGCVVRAICEAGLNPTIGIFHRNRSNPFCLADDLMEPFRPAVDFISLSEVNGIQELDREIKAKIVAVLSSPIRDTGETVQTAISMLASRLAIYFEGNSRKLEVLAWKP